MNLADVRDEIGTALESIPGLRVFRYEVETVTPPAAIVGIRTFTYDQAFQRGLDRWAGVIWVVVSSVFDRNAWNAIGPYVDAHSDRSIHAALRGRTWTSCAYARAVSCTFPDDGIIINGVPHLGAEIDLDIAGTGS